MRFNMRLDAPRNEPYRYLLGRFQTDRAVTRRPAEIVGQGKAEADDRFRERERGPAVVCYNICNKQGLLANTSAR